jgi:CSLREA domain-containing protein
MARLSAVALAGTLLAACTEPSAQPLLEPEPVPEFALGPKGTRTVTSLDDPGTGDCLAQSCTLRQAIAIAEPGDRIIFKTNLVGRIVLTAGQLLIDKDLTIDGERRITVDASGASRVLAIEKDRNVTLVGLTITGAGGPPGALPYGGGIFAGSNVTLTIRNSTIVGNSALFGGGIVNSDGSLAVINSSVLSNRSIGAGGGIYNTAGLTTIVGSTIADNESGPGLPSGGGGLFNNSGPTYHGTMVIVNSTVSGNRAAGAGGGIFNADDAVLTVKHSTITQNHGAGWGGLWTMGPTMLTNSILGGNTAGNPATLGADCTGVFAPGTVTSGGYNLGILQFCVSAEPGDVFLADPADIFGVLSPTLADNGGPTWTHALIEGGLAIDAGSCPDQSMDQRGLPRPFNHLARANVADGCDMGAFEWLPRDGNTVK